MRAVSIWMSTLPWVVSSVVEVAVSVIVPWFTRAFEGLVTVTSATALLPAFPNPRFREGGANENCQSVGRPESDHVSATFPVFRTTMVYVTESPAAIWRFWDASHDSTTDRSITFARARFTTLSVWSTTVVVAR